MRGQSGAGAPAHVTMVPGQKPELELLSCKHNTVARVALVNPKRLSDVTLVYNSNDSLSDERVSESV